MMGWRFFITVFSRNIILYFFSAFYVTWQKNVVRHCSTVGGRLTIITKIAIPNVYILFWNIYLGFGSKGWINFWGSRYSKYFSEWWIFRKLYSDLKLLKINFLFSRKSYVWPIWINIFYTNQAQIYCALHKEGRSWTYHFEKKILKIQK